MLTEFIHFLSWGVDGGGGRGRAFGKKVHKSYWSHTPDYSSLDGRQLWTLLTGPQSPTPEAVVFFLFPHPQASPGELRNTGSGPWVLCKYTMDPSCCGLTSCVGRGGGSILCPKCSACSSSEAGTKCNGCSYETSSGTSFRAICYSRRNADRELAQPYLYRGENCGGILPPEPVF